ncbi:hypothetical protein JCM8097_000409 [Rhodosporidiobolus ruineniae]
MKCKTFEIRWHDKTPIFSTDFHATPPHAYKKAHHPYAAGSGSGGVDSAFVDEHERVKVEKEREEREKKWRLATCGADNNIRLWLVQPRPPPSATPALPPAASSSSKRPAPSTASQANPDPSVEYLATLTQHTATVNCVRFAPQGETLASAGDDGNILIWVPGESTKKMGESEEDRLYEKESWRVKSMVRSMTGKEIYDLAWSPDGEKIIAGSVDHSATVYDVATGLALCRITDHGNYVQGVAWDPLEQYIATQSSDRSMHVYTYANAPTGLTVHAVGKNIRMDVQRRPTPTSRSSSQTRGESSKKPESSSKDRPSIGDASSSSAGKLERPPMHQRSLSRASDSDRSEASSTAPSSIFSAPPSAAPKPDEVTTAMDPPSSIPHHPKPTSSHSHSHSRRSSNSGSAPSQSPALGPSPSSRPLRSPSPAPLPAVMVPLSPRLNPVASSSANGNFNESVQRTDTIRLYGDAASTPFFRRLAWSPDGGLLLTPAGLFEDPYAAVEASTSAAGAVAKEKKEKKSKKEKDEATPAAGGAAKPGDPKPTVYIYARNNLARPPIAHLPGHKTTSIAIRFCPVLWELKNLPPAEEGKEVEEVDEASVSVTLSADGADVELAGSSSSAKGKEKEQVADDKPASSAATVASKPKPRSLFDLPYRMVYAVATHDSVYLYDTQQATPIAMFGNLHWKPFTDLTWSPDGQTLMISSQDGYCSIVAFSPGELGTPYPTQPAHARSNQPHHLHDPHAHHRHASSGPSPSPAKPVAVASSAAVAASPAPASATEASGSLPALFAKSAAAAASSPAKPASSGDESSSAGEKRAGEADAAAGTDGEAPPAKKQKKRVAPTLVRPLAE